MQIDTINVIERCHHHILYTRIPAYQREHLRQAQSIDKTVFEYWTHALSYLPTSDHALLRQRHEEPLAASAACWFSCVTDKDLRKVLGLMRKQGALTIRDIDDDVLVDKEHPWASRKPSKRALQLAFYRGTVTISQRSGMLKTYELTTRHFGWPTSAQGRRSETRDPGLPARPGAAIAGRSSAWIRSATSTPSASRACAS